MTTPELSHYSTECIDQMRPVTYIQSVGFKPVGFWVSVDSDLGWAEWCLAHEIRSGALLFRHVVDVDLGRVLVINDPRGMREFTKAYRDPDPRWGTIMTTLDWRRVAQEFAGILIPRYMWSMRLAEGHMWYYGWDCASGCIWDLGAIRSITEDRGWPENHMKNNVDGIRMNANGGQDG